ncbi:MAG: tetratricopeptide repeat protein [Acidobacteria bacterium]|nr:tetratricopeptide repeat protein [Acidobacteriota bacterium]
MSGSNLGRAARFLLPVLVGLLGAGASPGNLQRQTEFGIELARKGLWQEAIFRWKRSLAINPYSAILHNNLAVAYETLGRYDEAAREYERALELGRNRYEEIRENYESFMAFYSVYRESRPEEKEQEQDG